MAFEAEVPLFLIVGFSAVVGVSLLTLVFLFIKYRNLNLLFFVVQLVFLIFTFRWLYYLIKIPGDHPMYTAESSLSVGLAGVCWAVSMLFMLIGTYRIIRKKDK